MTGPLLGIICGMEAEARALGRWRRDPRLAVAISGGRADCAEAEARRLVGQGARALLSWGVAGGLDPALAPGALVAADWVTGPNGRTHPLATLPRGLAGAARDLGGGSARPPPGAPAAGVGLASSPPADARAPTNIWRQNIYLSPLAGSDIILIDAAAKAALRAGTGAAAVDMETHRVAAVAAEARLPCFALRAVSDPAGRALPRLAGIALDARGRLRPAAVLLGLLRRPADLPSLVAAARDSRAALAALAAAADDAMRALLAG